MCRLDLHLTLATAEQLVMVSLLQCTLGVFLIEVHSLVDESEIFPDTVLHI